MRAAPVPALPVLGASVALVVAAWLVGRSSLVSDLSLGAPPFIGHYDVRLGARALLPLSVAVVLVAVAPVGIERLRWRPLLLAGWAASAAFGVSLAAAGGRGAITAPLDGRYEYRAVLGEISDDGVGRFVRRFVDRLPDYPTHVRGHPVGAPLVFWAQERVGLHGSGWSAALVILVGTSTVVSAAVVVRLVAGEGVARRSLPFLVVTPALVWIVTSADALFAGVIAAAVALLALASVRRDRWGDAEAVVGGVAVGLALHLTYGAALLLLPAVVVPAVGFRRVRPLVLGAVGAGLVTGAFTAAGFWWVDGLAATRVEYAAGAGGVRPYGYFAVLANPAAFAVVLGPAVLVALVRLRDRRVWLVVGGALLAVVLADVSGMSKGEVERIWLPALPWLAVAAAALPWSRQRVWLAAQAGVALAVQVVLESPW